MLDLGSDGLPRLLTCPAFNHLTTTTTTAATATYKGPHPFMSSLLAPITGTVPHLNHFTSVVGAPAAASCRRLGPFLLLGHRTFGSSPSGQQPSPRKKQQNTKRRHHLVIMSRRPASSSSSSSSSNSGKNTWAAPAKPDPSSSVILLSPTNEVLLLHRVQASNSFPSAHVFPGGHISAFHEPDFPPPRSSSTTTTTTRDGSSSPLTADDPAFHQDSLPYRLAAIRETFEESGILLARREEEQQAAAPLLTLPPEEAAAFRTAVHGETVRFTDFLARRGARACTDELVPFTRWVTPAWNKGARRFTTQMYLFFMPLATSTSSSSPSSDQQEQQVLGKEADIITPTSDGGIEHTAATFAAPADWLRQQAEGRIILFPPQCFLLTLIARVFDAVATASSSSFSRQDDLYAAQRKALLDFVHHNNNTAAGGQDARDGKKAQHPTARIPWTEKVMSPEPWLTRAADGRIVLGLDKPGPELRGTGRGGDFERVVLVHFHKGGPRNVEVRQRADVVREKKEATGTVTKTKTEKPSTKL